MDFQIAKDRRIWKSFFCYNQYMRKMMFLLPLILLTACAMQATPTPEATQTDTPPDFATATLVPSKTPRPSLTPAPATVAPTVAPLLADLTNQVNVRTVADVKSKSLGVLPYGTKVQIIGKDAGLQWWQIVYPPNSASSGWISSAYVQVADADAATIPVVEPGGANPTASSPSSNQPEPSPVPNQSPTSPARTALVAKPMFVRSGPAQTYSSLGTIAAGTSVTLLGRTQNSVWVQIQYNGGTNGIAWVAAAFLSSPDLSGLPYFDSVGNAVMLGTPQPTTDPSQPTPTSLGFAAAAPDGDSLKTPAVNLKFAPAGAKEFSYSSDLSSPSGDTSDWVAFTPYEATNQATYIYFKLVCSGSGGITATLLKDGLPVSEVNALHCGNYAFAVHVLGGQLYVLQLTEDGSGGPLRFNSYTLTISTTP